MAIDILILNSAVADLRRPDFAFADELAGKGGLAKCETKDLPGYSQEQLHGWIEDGFATAGGPGNTAPLIARAGLEIAVGVNLGKGSYAGLDAQGRFFHDIMTANGINMSATHIHPTLPTGTTFIHATTGGDRGGIAYFPNANNDFNFELFKPAVKRLEPRIVYYMYSGLSDRGDANGGRDLAEFIRWCREGGALTIADSHTLTGSPHELINSGKAVDEYRLLEPLLPELDVFFTSCDEARLIENTLASGRKWGNYSNQENDTHFLDFLTERFWRDENRTRFFGVTVRNGALEKHISANGVVGGPDKVTSRFMAGEVIDLIGAGDSFRAGLISYLARNLDVFREGKIDFAKAVQMGNLFASLFIKAPLGDRYGNIRPLERMLDIVHSGRSYHSFDMLQER